MMPSPIGVSVVDALISGSPLSLDIFPKGITISTFEPNVMIAISVEDLVSSLALIDAIKFCRPMLSCFIGLPIIEPDVSSAKQIGNLLLVLLPKSEALKLSSAIINLRPLWQINICSNKLYQKRPKNLPFFEVFSTSVTAFFCSSLSCGLKSFGTYFPDGAFVNVFLTYLGFNGS